MNMTLDKIINFLGYVFGSLTIIIIAVSTYLSGNP